MRQALGPGALGKPSGSGWRGRWEGGSGWGTHVNPWLFYSNVWQNSLQIKKKKWMLHGLLQGIKSPYFFKFSMMGFNTSLTLCFSGYCFLYGNRCRSLNLINNRNSILCLTHIFSINPHSRMYIFVELMCEKERASYSWKQRSGSCSIHLSPEGWEILWYNQKLVSKQKRRHCNLKDDWNNRAIWSRQHH